MMTHQILSIIFSYIFISVYGDRALDWFSIDCPASVADTSCTYTNPYDVDIAVSLFFQTEDENDGSSFQCSSTTTPLSKNQNNRRLISKSKSSLTCPTPMVYKFINFWSYCVLEDLVFPSDLSKVSEYCEYLTQGYEGFTFTKIDFPTYKCPSSMTTSSNNDGTTFCVFNLPQETITNLPNDTQSYCSTQAFTNGELGFRFNNNGTTTMPPTTPTPTMNNLNNIIYCSRKWTELQLGSAGDCYFILPAKESFNCDGKGTTNMIGVFGVELRDSFFDINNKNNINIIGDVTKYTNNNDADEFIYLEIESLTKDVDNFLCYYNDFMSISKIYTCNFTTNNGASSIYSCNFLLPSNNTMLCEYNNNNIYISSSISRLLKNTMFNSKSNNIITNLELCPNNTYPQSTFCDCYFENPYPNNDVLIIMNAINTDNQFNSFHCFIWGVNVCAWGANNDNTNDGGGCYFILPAGAMYNCSMEWGETAFSQTTAIKLDTTIYVNYTNINEIKKINKKDITKTKLPYSRNLNEMKLLWNQWKLRYNKYYETKQEELKRFNNFQYFVSLVDNNAIANPNGKNNKIPEIKNENADLSVDEFNNIYRDCSFPIDDMYDKETNLFKIPSHIDIHNLPKSVDWRTKGAITPIKNQGQCGSCWAFSTTGVLSSHWFIQTNELQSLSEQTLVSCDDKDGNDGCNGGWPYVAITYVSENGIDTESSYNYTSGEGEVARCKVSDGVLADVSVSSYQMIENNEDAMAAYVANYGPISISLDAMTQIWWPYTSSSGIMKSCCDKDVDHAVLIVGYDVTSTGEQYWIIKNSWGTDWGYDGYIYLEKGTDQCGITYQPVVPVLNN